MRKDVFCFIMLLPFLLAACTMPNATSKSVVPEYGEWYCEELQLQLSFDNHKESFVLIDGKQVSCSFENDRGSRCILVAFLYGNYYYDASQVFFMCNCDYWDEEKMIVTELIDKEIIDDGFLFKENQYTFARVDKPQDEK